MALQSERLRATFPLEQMSHLLYGSPEAYEHFLHFQRVMESEPGLHYDPNYYNKSRQEQVSPTLTHK